MKKIIVIIVILIGGRFAVVYGQSSQIKITAMEQSIKEFKQLRKQAAKFEDTDTAKAEIAIIDAKIAGLQKAILDEKIAMVDNNISLSAKHKTNTGGTSPRVGSRQARTWNVEQKGLETKRIASQVDNQIKREENVTTFDSIDQQLHYKKMLNMPVYTDSIKGYMGIIHNPSNSNSCSVIIRSVKPNGDEYSTLLTPGELRQVYLLPGKYICTFVVNGTTRNTEAFSVPRIADYAGISCNWWIRTLKN